MRLRSWAGLALAGFLLVVTGGWTARAQGFFPFFPGFSYGAPPQPSGRRYYDPGRASPSVRRPYYRERQTRRRSPRAEREVRASRRHLRPVPALANRKAEPPKPAVEPSTYIVVFGDSLAEMLSDGLNEAYDEAPEIEVDSKTKGDSGLVRTDVHDWAKSIQDYLNGNPKITFAVMMAGVNDRQAIRDGDVVHDPLSDRWREIYRERVDAVARAFADRKIPLLWVGAPPVKNEKFSADLAAINDIVRERVQAAGGVYVDIAPGFLDDKGRYVPVGPNVEGQTVRLRAGDGVHFTEAGARKAAHFAEVEIKRLLEARSGAGAAAAASPGSAPGPSAPATAAVEPESGGAAPPSAKPAAGPVLPLTRADVSPGGVLLTGQKRPDGNGGAAAAADRAFRQGVAPGPKPGRADDFRWPRS